MSSAAKSASSQPNSGSEGRKTPRRRMLKSGKIVSLNKVSTFDCTLRNVSRTGALLIVPSVTGIPNEFYLLVPGHQALIRTRVAWKTSNRLGVEFLDDPGDIRAN